MVVFHPNMGLKNFFGRLRTATLLRWSIVLVKNQLLQPFVKWAGGKRQLLEPIKRHIPKNANVYFEPFLGGGAILFGIQPQRAIVNDINAQLVATYEVVRDYVDELIEDLSVHKNEKNYFYALRAVDRQLEYQDWSPVQKASRLIFLNRTCFNDIRSPVAKLPRI